MTTTTTAPRVPAHGTRMTLEDFLALQEDVRAELVDGVLLYKNPDPDVTPARRPHGSIAARLSHAVISHVLAHNLGEVFDSSTEFILRREPPLVLVPDVSFVRRERLPEDLADDEAEYAVLAPDLAVEVISPSNSAREVARKVARYLEHGVRRVWIVDPPARTVAVHAPGAAARMLGTTEVLEGDDVIPGLRIPGSDLFAGLSRRG